MHATATRRAPGAPARTCPRTCPPPRARSGGGWPVPGVTGAGVQRGTSLDDGADLEVLDGVVRGVAAIAVRQLDAARGEELSADDARVALGRLVDGHKAVGQVERDNEFARRVLRVRLLKLGCKSQHLQPSTPYTARHTPDLVAELEQVEVVGLGRLGHDRPARLRRVLRRADADVRRQRLQHMTGCSSQCSRRTRGCGGGRGSSTSTGVKSVSPKFRR